MRSINRQFDVTSWPTLLGPIVVLCDKNNTVKSINKNHTGNRDGPLIFHMRDGSPSDTDPPCGTGPPILSGTGPPKITGPPMEWLAKKKTLKRFQ